MPESAGPARAPSNLTLRVLSACVFVPGILSLVYLGGLALFLLVLGIAARCGWEFYRMAGQAGYHPASLLGGLLIVATCTHVYRWGAENLHLALCAAALLCFAGALYRGTERYAANAFLTLGGVLYAGLLGSAPLFIARAAGPEAGYLLALLFLCVWLTDAVAYTCGRLWGREKLAPSISPAKTRVGFVSGLVGGLVPLGLQGFLPSFSPAALAALLLLVSAGGQVGDLVESAIKRDFGLKDAPALIPGHGGLLDRFDSYFFAFPLAYLYVEIFAIF